MSIFMQKNRKRAISVLCIMALLISFTFAPMMEARAEVLATTGLFLGAAVVASAAIALGYVVDNDSNFGAVCDSILARLQEVGAVVGNLIRLPIVSGKTLIPVVLADQIKSAISTHGDVGTPDTYANTNTAGTYTRSSWHSTAFDPASCRPIQYGGYANPGSSYYIGYVRQYKSYGAGTPSAYASLRMRYLFMGPSTTVTINSAGVVISNAVCLYAEQEDSRYDRWYYGSTTYGYSTQSFSLGTHTDSYGYTYQYGYNENGDSRYGSTQTLYLYQGRVISGVAGTLQAGSGTVNPAYSVTSSSQPSTITAWASNVETYEDPEGDIQTGLPITVYPSVPSAAVGTQSVAQTGATSQDVVQSAVEAAEIEDMSVSGLASVFPFCIPFDIYNFLSAFSHAREAPSVTIPLAFPEYIGGTQEIAIDLSSWDSVASVLRTLELIAFIVGLAVETRKFIKW